MDDDKDSEDDILIKGGNKSQKKRQRLDNSTKEFLEKVFEKNKQPNRRKGIDSRKTRCTFPK